MKTGLGAVLVAVLLTVGCDGDPLPPDPLGAVRVTVTTTGSGEDADGYTVSLGENEATLTGSGSALFEELPAGSYVVALEDVAANCSVAGGSTRPVTVEDAEESNVSFDVDCVYDAAGVTLSVTSCPALAPSALEGLPLDRISLGSVPAGIERPILARVSWAGGPDVSMGLTYDDGEGVDLVLPLHPGGSLEGGDVTVRISDETESCPPFAFRILPMPRAEGELTDLVDVAQQLLDQQAVLFGTTRSELLGTPWSDLEPTLVPLAVAQALVDEPGNGGSLRALVDGAVPDFGAEDLDFVERLMARTGLREDLEAELALVSAPGPARGAAAAPSPGLALDCVLGGDGMDASLLDECMTLARDKAQGAASAATQDNAILAMDMAALLGSRRRANPISTLITFSKIYDQAVADNLPSSFTEIEVTLNPAEFFEDQPGPGDWSPAMVTATSNGWSMTDLVSEVIESRITPDIRRVRGRLTQRERYLMRVARPDGWSEIRQVEDFYQGLLEQLVGALVGRGVNLEAEFLTVPPMTYGPVDVTDTEWSDARIVTGTSVVLTSHEEYEPREPGTSLLEVVTAVGKFGGTSIATPFQPIVVEELSVSIAPTEVIMEPGRDTSFVVTVHGALHPDSVELLGDHPEQGSAELVLGETFTHTIRYTAPADPAPNSTDLVAVHHVGQGGARGGSATPRSASALIRFAELDLLPVQGCVTPGQDVQLEWELSGFETAPELVWTPSAGSVDENGVFTAPGQAGTVTIEVAVAGASGLSDSIEVPVGECVCSFTMEVGGNTYVGLPGDEVSYFSADGIVPGRPYAVGSVSFANAAGFSAVAGVEVPTVAADAPGSYALSTISGGLGYGGAGDFFEDVDPPQGTLNIIQYEPHSVLVGEIVGGVVEDAFDPDGSQYTFSASFQIYPPEGSLGWTYTCVIPDPEGG